MPTLGLRKVSKMKREATHMPQDYNPVGMLFYAIYQAANGELVADTSDGFALLCVIGGLIIVIAVSWLAFVASKLSRMATALSDIDAMAEVKRMIAESGDRREAESAASTAQESSASR